MQAFSYHTAEKDMWKYYLQLKEKDKDVTFPQSVVLWICSGKGEQFRDAWLKPKSFKQLN
ncbi:MAG: hypothetical protein Kow00108_18730 [Calditrichia bacterium]